MLRLKIIEYEKRNTKINKHNGISWRTTKLNPSKIMLLIDYGNYWKIYFVLYIDVIQFQHKFRDYHIFCLSDDVMLTLGVKFKGNNLLA